MLKFGNLRLRTKFMIAFLAVGIIPFAVIGIVAMLYASNGLSTQAFNQLQSIRDVKKSQIERYFSERTGDAKVLSNNPFIRRAFKELGAAFFSGDGSGRGNFKGLGNENYNAPEEYRMIHDQYFPVLKHYMDQYGYYDVFLLSPEQGDVVFSVTKEPDFGQKTNAVDSSLRDVWRQAVKEGRTAISDTKRYEPSGGAPAQFVASPIKENGETIGVVAMQISIDGIGKIMGERSGLGKTGETYLVGSDKLMRSDSFLDPTDHSVKASFANPDKGKVDTEATREALSGNRGNKIITDYNGNPVLSAYVPVKVGDTTWAVVAEIDEAEAFAPVSTLQHYILIVGIVGVLAIIGIALLFTRTITLPIRKGTDFAKEMSDGDFTNTLDIDRKDEIGVLAGALNSMVSSLGAMIRELKTGVDTLSSSSTELSAISEQMSSGAVQTAGKSNTVATAAEEMSANMTSVAAATEQASTNVNMVAAASEEMTATISEIAENTEKARVITDKAVLEAKSASTTVDELGKAAREIGKVTESITEISEQTNLLALNATIEAARAGDAGKGFAVVANEIKELAKQTAEATDEIKRKIEGIQNSTDGTVKQIEQISTVINEVNEIVSIIATAVEEQSTTTKEIAGNVAQAAQGIQEVTENVNQSSTVAGEIAKDISNVNQASKEMSSSSSQVNVSAEQLSTLAEQLKQMTERFRVT